MRLKLDSARFLVEPFPSSIHEIKFDVGIYSIGYEERSRFVVSSIGNQANRLLAIDLGGGSIGSYETNKQLASGRSGKVVKRSRFELKKTFEWSKSIGDGDANSFFVDVSSMDRHTMSLLIYRLMELVGDKSAEIYFLYSPSKYSEPPSYQPPVDSSGPVNALLAGYPKDPRFPTVLFLGLGFEVGLSLGVVDQFEPARVFAYAPRGHDQQFDAAVDEVNAPLLDDQRYVNRFEYNIASPASAFINLKERVLGLRDSAKIILVPLGPKIFSAMCILIGYLYSPDTAVWRFSTQVDPASADKKPDGSIVGFRLRILPAAGAAKTTAAPS